MGADPEVILALSLSLLIQLTGSLLFLSASSSWLESVYSSARLSQTWASAVSVSPRAVAGPSMWQSCLGSAPISLAQTFCCSRPSYSIRAEFSLCHRRPCALSPQRLAELALTTTHSFPSLCHSCLRAFALALLTLGLVSRHLHGEWTDGTVRLAVSDLGGCSRV